MKQIVILDKSYLKGKPSEVIQNLCLNNVVLMSSMLLFELLTSSRPEDCAQCFRKFPTCDNPVELIEPVHVLLKFEIDHQKAAHPLFNHRININFKFNEKLRDGVFPLSSLLQSKIDEWSTQIGERVQYHRNFGSWLRNHYPPLARYSPGQPSDGIDRLKHSLANDVQTIRTVYANWSRESQFPPSDALTPEWAMYRRLQVDLFVAFEHIRRYGAQLSEIQAPELVQDAADQEILVLACLAGGLASCDKNLTKHFKLLCPDGLLLS